MTVERAGLADQPDSRGLVPAMTVEGGRRAAPIDLGFEDA